MSGEKKFMIPRGHGKSRMTIEYLRAKLACAINCKNITTKGRLSLQAIEFASTQAFVLGKQKEPES